VAEWLNNIKGERLEIKKSLGISRASSNLVVCDTMEYFCNECSGIVELSYNEPIICNFCGSRILYKSRTKQILQYEARKNQK